MRLVELIVDAISAEWILQWRPNGATAILLRSLWVTTIILGWYLCLQNWLDPHRLWWTFSLNELHLQLSGSLHLIGPIFAGVYAAFYTRFASQWSYLASVYNQIKAAETRKDCNSQHVALWKAGFIEDAQELHLANKHHFASTIRAWGREPEVEAAFAEHAPGGSERLAILLKKADEIFLTHSQRYPRKQIKSAASTPPSDQAS